MTLRMKSTALYIVFSALVGVLYSVNAYFYRRGYQRGATQEATLQEARCRDTEEDARLFFAAGDWQILREL